MTDPNERFLDWSTSTVRVTPRPATEPEPPDEPDEGAESTKARTPNATPKDGTDE